MHAPTGVLRLRCSYSGRQSFWLSQSTPDGRPLLRRASESEQVSQIWDDSQPFGVSAFSRDSSPRVTAEVDGGWVPTEPDQEMEPEAEPQACEIFTLLSRKTTAVSKVGVPMLPPRQSSQPAGPVRRNTLRPKAH